LQHHSDFGIAPYISDSPFITHW